VISRQWRGLAKPGHADMYVEHLRTQTFPALRRLAGFKGAAILRRDVAAGVEFLVITEWESVEAIRAFAGANVDDAVLPPEVDAMMIEYDRRVRHYEVVAGQ
jgi:heme-degrading monooxygenase HmoA